jgi:hypothetical protein
MAISITDNQISKTPNNLHESIPDEHHNSYFNVKCNSKDIHFKYRNNRSNKNVYVEGLLRVYHQNIMGLKGKVNELLLSFLDEAPLMSYSSSERLRNGYYSYP